MSLFLNILMVIALLIVLGTLVFGMINLTKPDRASQLKSNKLMRVRVISQGIAVLLLFFIIMVKSKTGA